MKLKLTFTLIISLALFLISCSAETPLTVAQIQETQIATATEVFATREAEIEGVLDTLRKIAPEGSVVADVLPERGHDDTLQYPFEGMPLAGGPHNGQWQKCEIYDEPVKQEHAIHSMEHGGIVINYHPDLSENDIEDLEDYAKGENFVLMAPYPNLPEPIVLSAWAVQLAVDSPDDDRIEDFILRFSNGPQNQEPGANCLTGVTLTVDG